MNAFTSSESSIVPTSKKSLHKASISAILPFISIMEVVTLGGDATSSAGRGTDFCSKTGSGAMAIISTSSIISTSGTSSTSSISIAIASTGSITGSGGKTTALGALSSSEGNGIWISFGVPRGLRRLFLIWPQCPD